MQDGAIVVMDSGIGGLTILEKMIKSYPLENYVYLSDCINMPYGNKSSEQVKELCKKNLNRALEFKPKKIIIACNTMSLTGRSIFEKCVKIPILFVQPNVKKMYDLGLENCLLMCTPLSAKNKDIVRLFNLRSDCILAMDNLALEIQKKRGSKVDFINEKLKDLLKSKKYIFLGCTHYNFLIDQIKEINNNLIFFDGSEEFIQKCWDSCPLNVDAINNHVKFVGSGKKMVKDVFLQRF